MLLRREGHLILWVTAALSLSGMIFDGTGEAPQVALESVERDGPVGGLPTKDPPQSINNDSWFLGRTLPEIDRGARPLFRVVLAPVEPQTEPVVQESVPILPVLKGIVASNGEFRAIFVLEASSGEYTVAGVGDQLAGYRINTIEVDRVVATSDAGTTSTFVLRGAGETP